MGATFFNHSAQRETTWKTSKTRQRFNYKTNKKRGPKHGNYQSSSRKGRSRRRRSLFVYIHRYIPRVSMPLYRCPCAGGICTCICIFYVRRVAWQLWPIKKGNNCNRQASFKFTNKKKKYPSISHAMQSQAQDTNVSVDEDVSVSVSMWMLLLRSGLGMSMAQGTGCRHYSCCTRLLYLYDIMLSSFFMSVCVFFFFAFVFFSSECRARFLGCRSASSGIGMQCECERQIHTYVCML